MGPHSSRIRDSVFHASVWILKGPVDGLRLHISMRRSIFHLKRALLLRELGSRPEFRFLIPRLNEAATTISYKCRWVSYIIQDDRGILTQRRGKPKVRHHVLYS